MRNFLPLAAALGLAACTEPAEKPTSEAFNVDAEKQEAVSDLQDKYTKNLQGALLDAHLLLGSVELMPREDLSLPPEPEQMWTGSLDVSGRRGIVTLARSGAMSEMKVHLGGTRYMFTFNTGLTQEGECLHNNFFALTENRISYEMPNASGQNAANEAFLRQSMCDFIKNPPLCLDN